MTDAILLACLEEIEPGQEGNYYSNAVTYINNALAAAGHKIVPREATGDMKKAGEANVESWWTKGRFTPIYGNEPGYIWQAMWDAAP